MNRTPTAREMIERAINILAEGMNNAVRDNDYKTGYNTYGSANRKAQAITLSLGFSFMDKNES